VSERLALDTDAAVDFIRDDRPTPPLISRVEQIVLPITVVGELFQGAESSVRPERNRAVIEALLDHWQPLLPTIETARIYGRIRAAVFQRTTNLSVSKRNDLWIAALCIQYELPLLTNDAGYDGIPGLTVIHW
jgi:tRNA(fMet)-specific endonuclease VapC